MAPTIIEMAMKIQILFLIVRVKVWEIKIKGLIF